MNRSFSSAIAVLAVLAFATPALAGGTAKPAAVVQVGYADLNLSSTADVRILEQRVHAAALSVCGPVDYPAGMGLSQFLQAREDNATCIAKAEAGARLHLAALQGHLTQTAAAGR